MKKLIAALRFLFRRRLKITSNVINTPIKDFHYAIDINNVINYGEAIENEKGQNLSKINKGKIHPLFYTKISWQIIEKLNNYLEIPIDEKILKTIVHQSENINFYKELLLPANLVVKPKLWSIGPHKKGSKLLIKFDYYSDNELVATEYSSGLLFGVKCIGGGQSLGETPKTIKINETPIWQEQIEIEKTLPYIYAKKAEIDAPIHTNPKFAKSIGLPDIILQGTCTFAKSVSLIVAKELNNDSSKIKAVSAKFTGMVVPPNQITVRLLKNEKKLLYFDVLNNKGKAVLKGGQIML